PREKPVNSLYNAKIQKEDLRIYHTMPKVPGIKLENLPTMPKVLEKTRKFTVQCQKSRREEPYNTEKQTTEKAYHTTPEVSRSKYLRIHYIMPKVQGTNIRENLPYNVKSV
ncbi:22553_t:CDS:2, partial [Gigaspora rosea]